ncbi:MAG: HlyD family efflux transporter periplasmic adaptor subunit [Lachnospiraceae bacterium]|nr:HlyD family efflux transporter periplasmic adaptor subunit [Lachnospiraceae bacterium]
MKWIKKHKKLCIVLVILLILGILIGRFIISMQSAAETMMSMLSQQETAAVERRSLVESISATGSVTSAGSKSVTAEVTGVKSLSVPVQVGDMVQEGDLLCLLDTADLEENLANSELSLSVTRSRTQLELDSAQRNLEEAGTSARIEQSRMDDQAASALKSYEEARERMNRAGSSYGSANQSSTEIRLALEDYQAQLAQVHEQLNLLTETGASVSGSDAADSAALEAEAARLEQLITEYQLQYSTAQETEKGLKSVYDQAVTAVNNAYDAYQKVLQSQEDTIRSGNSTLQSRQDSLTSSQLNAATSGISDQQQIDRYLEQIEACNVTAPISGVVTSVNLETGDSYNGGAIVTIEDISSYEVTVEIDEYDISKIEVGQRVVIKTNGTGDLELEGKVISIAPRATGGSSVTYTVKTSIDTPCEDLRMDMTAKLSIIISSKENVLTVPYAAVQTAEDGSYYVEVMDEGNPAAAGQQGGEPADEGQEESRDPGSSPAANQPQTRRISVTKGIESDYYVEISGEGITEGLEVIVPANNSLEDINQLLLEMGPMGGF